MCEHLFHRAEVDGSFILDLKFITYSRYEIFNLKFGTKYHVRPGSN